MHKILYQLPDIAKKIKSLREDTTHPEYDTVIMACDELDNIIDTALDSVTRLEVRQEFLLALMSFMYSMGIGEGVRTTKRAQIRKIEKT